MSKTARTPYKTKKRQKTKGRASSASSVSGAAILDFRGVTFGDSTLNTANLCPAISVVGLFYLLTVIMNFVCWSILDFVYSRMSVNVGHMYN